MISASNSIQGDRKLNSSIFNFSWSRDQSGENRAWPDGTCAGQSPPDHQGRPAGGGAEWLRAGLWSVSPEDADPHSLLDPWGPAST